MGVGYIYALGARLNIISFFDFNGMNFLYTCCFMYKVQINYVVYDTSIEDMVIGSHN